MAPRVAIIGGGISGLAAAHRIGELEPAAEVLLLEAGPRLGGVLTTVERDGFLLEAAADNFLTEPPAAVELCRRLGLKDALLGTHPQRRQALVVHRGRLQPIPAGFLVMAPSRIGPILTSPILSLAGKLRLALEYFLPPRPHNEDESLASFVRRRFGREVFERLVQPLVGGIYTADAQRLSMDATLPRFRQMERDHGSVLRAALNMRRAGGADAGSGASSGARYGQFAALRGGMSSLVKALASRLPQECLQLQSPVVALQPLAEGRWRLLIGGERPRQCDVDAVVVAAPAYRARALLRQAAPELSRRLSQIRYASCAVVSLGYRREQIGHPLDAAGLVVPLAEGRSILSCSFSSQKYAGRAPDDGALLRVFIGGACQAELLARAPRELTDLAEREVADLLGIRGQPILRNVVQHRRAMPQYHVGHRKIVTDVNRQLAGLPTLALAGNALSGVGVPACIQSGESAAESVLAGWKCNAALPIRTALSTARCL